MSDENKDNLTQDTKNVNIKIFVKYLFTKL